MIWIENMTFRDQDVKLDFSRWRRCDFVNCDIVVEYGIFDLVECEFSGCRLSVQGHAQAIMKVAKLFFPIIPMGEDAKGTFYVVESLNWLCKQNLDVVRDVVREWVKLKYGHETTGANGNGKKETEESRQGQDEEAESVNENG